MTRSIRLTAAAFVIVLAAACGDGDGAGTTTQGTQAPAPDPGGETTTTQHTQPAGPEAALAAGLTVAEFQASWNAVVPGLGHDQLAVAAFQYDNWDGLDVFEHRFTDWLLIYGAMRSDSDQVAWVYVEWRHPAGFDRELLLSSMTALVLASAPGLGPDGALAVLRDLGFADATASAIAAGIDGTVTRAGLVFDAYSRDFGGEIGAYCGSAAQPADCGSG